MSFQHFMYKGVKFAIKAHTEETVSFAEKEFEVLDDDIFNVTYPKSGTNWMIEILNLIKHDGDPAISHSTPIYERSPWVETIGSRELMQKLSSPRVISSHMPFQLFPQSFFKSKAKIIYTMRNPRDIVVSLYHFTKILHLFKEAENFQDVLEDFAKGNALYGSWFDHIKTWLKEMKDDSRFFFITYEELLEDLRGSVVRICKFLGKQLDDAQIDSVVNNSSFKTMKENKMSNWSLMPSDVLDQSKGSFLRKGTSGDWKNHFTVAQQEYFDHIYQEKMKDLNMSLYWEKL
ncbi:sulfotransferase 2B1-like [Gastrophryne carolinensis]